MILLRLDYALKLSDVYTKSKQSRATVEIDKAVEFDVIVVISESAILNPKMDAKH